MIRTVDSDVLQNLTSSSIQLDGSLEEIKLSLLEVLQKKKIVTEDKAKDEKYVSKLVDDMIKENKQNLHIYITKIAISTKNGSEVEKVASKVYDLFEGGSGNGQSNVSCVYFGSCSNGVRVYWCRWRGGGCLITVGDCP